MIRQQRITHDGSKKNIPWAKPCLWGDEARLIQEAVASTWISGGPFVDKLEQFLCRYFDTPHGFAVSNGTTAIHLAYLALDLKPGDEVIVPAYGFLAAANLALQLGVTPVFCDVDDQSWLAAARHIEPCITPQTKAIVVVHTYGNVCAMDSIMDLAHHHRIAVIEDTAEAFGSRYNHRWAGTFGDMGTFSFQATKTVTTGEGGFVVTPHEHFTSKIALYRSHGMLRKVYYWHELPGHNFRLTNIQAAMGYAQVQHLDTIYTARHRIHQSYRRLLEDVDGVQLQYFSSRVDPVVWAIALQLDPEHFPQGRDAVIQQMRQRGIETRPGFYTPARLNYFKAEPLPASDRISPWILSLPMFVELTDQQIDTIVAALLEVKA